MQGKVTLLPYIKSFRRSKTGLSPVRRTKGRIQEQFTEEGAQLDYSQRNQQIKSPLFSANQTVQDEKREGWRGGEYLSSSSLAAGDLMCYSLSQKEFDNRQQGLETTKKFHSQAVRSREIDMWAKNYIQRRLFM